MKLSRYIILSTLMLGSIVGSIAAMFPGYTQAPQYNMGNMFGQQPNMYMPQQQYRFNQMPYMRQQFANPMMNQFGNQSAGDQALSAFISWMTTNRLELKDHYLNQAITYTIRNLSDKYYPQKLKNIWWTRVIIDTVLARLTTVGVSKIKNWFTDNGQEEIA